MGCAVLSYNRFDKQICGYERILQAATSNRHAVKAFGMRKGNLGVEWLSRAGNGDSGTSDFRVRITSEQGTAGCQRRQKTNDLRVFVWRGARHSPIAARADRGSNLPQRSYSALTCKS